MKQFVLPLVLVHALLYYARKNQRMTASPLVLLRREISCAHACLKFFYALHSQLARPFSLIWELNKLPREGSYPVSLNPLLKFPGSRAPHVQATANQDERAQIRRILCGPLPLQCLLTTERSTSDPDASGPVAADRVSPGCTTTRVIV